MSELYGMTYGGNGSHWDGCENVHWDCRIVRLERRITELEACVLPDEVLKMAEWALEEWGMLQEASCAENKCKEASAIIRKARYK